MADGKTNKPPDVPILDGIQVVSQDQFRPFTENIERQGKLLDWTFGFIIAVLIACFLGFVTFAIDAWKFHAEKTEEYTKAIQVLQKENSDLKLDVIEKRLDKLEGSKKDTQHTNQP